MMESPIKAYISGSISALEAAERYLTLSRFSRCPSIAMGTSGPDPEAQITCQCFRHKGTDPEIAALSDKVGDYARGGTGVEVLRKVPTDIFIEIAQYLHPLDLLHFSKANRFLQELFTSPEAVQIWRAAQLGVPRLPPCPLSICEPQYAALLFEDRCTTCGKQTSNHVDATLLVRLCAECYREQAIDASTVMDPSLVFTSYESAYGPYPAGWCLSSDAQGVLSKLGQLNAPGDRAAKAHWMRERRREVNQRYWRARPLREWFHIYGCRTLPELAQYARARQDEIESRLRKLGWEEGDFISSESRRNNRLTSLMSNPGPLTDSVWEELLPNLLACLKPNRQERLQLEMTARKYERELILRDYMHAIKGELVPFARLIPESESPAVNSADSSWNFEHNKSLLANPFPSARQAYSRSEIRTLLEADMPTEDFITKLVEQQGMLTKLIADWKRELEASLGALLPDGITSPQLGNPSIIIAGGEPINNSLEPNGEVPTDVKKLLRADVAFMGHDRLRFYPDDFVNTNLTAGNIIYHTQAAKIAKALLGVLKRPDALYLELKALGRAFYCGRCHSPPRYMAWHEIVQHYLTEGDTWYRHSVAREVCEAEGFTLVFTHDVDMVKPNEPLVLMRIVNYSGSFTVHHGSTRRCKMCQRVLIRQWCHADYIIDHVRDVHLIQEPKQGTHYS